MPKVTFIEHDGTPHPVEADIGSSLMRAAADNDVPGIDADCGGECACATCHVILSDTWFSVVGIPNDVEEAMLSCNPLRQTNSRLSCQIPVEKTLDGLEVQLPEFQY